jgi:Uma2 family endonuclease
MSTAVAAKTHHTPEDLLAMPDGKSYELVGGRLVERHMGIESSWVGSRIIIRLGPYCEEHRLGCVLQADSGYQCFPHDPGMVRRPDASFVRTGRFPGDVLPKGWAKIPPDLAVEVVSPNDLVYKLEEKLGDYRKVGVPLVWVINPESRTVMVHRRDGSISRLQDHDELSGEDVIPGFRCPIREILPALKQSEEAQSTPTRTNGPG